MDIPRHTQSADQQKTNTNFYEDYIRIRTHYNIAEKIETYEDDWYQETKRNTGIFIHTSEPIMVKGLKNPNDDSEAKVILIKRTNGQYSEPNCITVSARTKSGTHKMYDVHKDGVYPPECAELARFILNNME